MKTDRFLSLNILLLLSIVLLFSCKKDEVTEPDDGYDIPLPVIYWERGSEIDVYQDIIVDNFILFIDKGVNVRFMNGAKIIVGKMYCGAIIAKGTEDEPINFTPMPDTTQPDEYWNGIDIINNHPDIISTFEHCNFIKGCGKENDAVLIVKRGYISIKNCLFDYSKKYGVQLKSSTKLVEFENNIIKHTLDHPMVMSAYNVHKIGENNIFITDVENKGIYLNAGSYKDTEFGAGSSGDDTIVWKPQTVPYIVGEELYFENGKVRICAGTIIAMNYSYSHIYVKSNYFEAIGTAEKPIIFTSNKKVKKPGDWESLVVSNNVVFKNCIFEYGGYDMPNIINIGMINIGSSSYATFDSCTFRYSQRSAIFFSDNYNNHIYFKDFSNNTFSALETFAISLPVSSIESIGENNKFNNYRIYVMGNKITRNYTLWKNVGAEFYVNEFISITGPNSKLVIEPGVVICFNGGGFSIGSSSNTTSIISKGTSEKPIVFTSYKENPDYGDWAGIRFGEHSSSESILEYCQILYAGNIDDFSSKSSIKILADVKIKNCIIAHSKHWGIIYSTQYNPVFENNTYFDNLDGDIFGVGE
jgi:hypothetical protein